MSSAPYKYDDAQAVPMAVASPVNVDIPVQGDVQAQPYYSPKTSKIDDDQVEKLMEQGYTRGLVKSLELTKQEFAYKIWIVDNSGSMQTNDGHKMVDSRHHHHHVKMVPCSRWEEIHECVDYHMQMAEATDSRTTFRLLNHPGASAGAQQFTIADGIGAVIDGKRIMSKVRPGGCTPLSRHIIEIHQEISALASTLNQNGQKVAIIIATDGLPTDERGYGGDALQQEFVQSLRLLEPLPVWIVIRLCTDNDDVVSFYNDLDDNLELSIEVLDDYHGEATEVHKYNPWVTYSLLLHRLRELGYHDKLLDRLDEQRLSKSELRDFTFLLFGEENFDGVADPNVDWHLFVKDIERLQKNEKLQWDPVKKRMRPWIDTKELSHWYGESACTIC